MKVNYLPSFIRDLKALKKSPIYATLHALVFQEILTYTSIGQIPNLKKLRGDDQAYRIRVGEYRIGVFIDSRNHYPCPRQTSTRSLSPLSIKPNYNEMSQWFLRPSQLNLTYKTLRLFTPAQMVNPWRKVLCISTLCWPRLKFFGNIWTSSKPLF